MSQSNRSPEFNAALERLGVVAQIFDQGVPADQVIRTAVKGTLRHREATLAFNLLREACGAVFADEIGISVDSFVVREQNNDTTHEASESPEYQAAFYLAYNMRHSGRNDLFIKIGEESSILNTINRAMNSDPDMKLEDLKGAQLSFLVWL